MPGVSIVLPTYNRCDTITRAIESVLNQTFQDWELIVIDDGSTDSTSKMDFGIDSRIRVIRQDNQGVAAARNNGLLASQGRFIAFLDSDDEWLPHFLDLSVGFLKAFPEEQFVTLEFLGDDTEYRMIKGSFMHTYLSAARMIGSNALELLPGETDDYLRIYPTKHGLGVWGTKCLSEATASESHLYQGHVFHHTRWGYLAWLPTTVLTRHALEVVGIFDVSRRHATDYPFLATLSKQFRTNFISTPSARKHEYGLHSNSLQQNHLAAGPNSYAFRINRLYFFDNMHWQNNKHDRELSLVRQQYIYNTALVALRSGMRKEAMMSFSEVSTLRSPFWRSYLFKWLAFCCMNDKNMSASYKILSRLLNS